MQDCIADETQRILLRDISRVRFLLSRACLKPLDGPFLSLKISPSSERWIVLGHGQFAAASIPFSLHHCTDSSLNESWARFPRVVSRKRRTLPDLNFGFHELTFFVLLELRLHKCRKHNFASAFQNTGQCLGPLVHCCLIAKSVVILLCYSPYEPYFYALMTELPLIRF